MFAGPRRRKSAREGVEHADIDGKFDGALLVSGKVTVRRGARLAGRLSCGQLEVEAGAEIRGTIKMRSDVHNANGGATKWSWPLRRADD